MASCAMLETLLLAQFLRARPCKRFTSSSTGYTSHARGPAIAATFECNICSIHHLVRTRLLAYNYHQLTSRSSDQHPAPTNTLLTRYHADGYIAHRG